MSRRAVPAALPKMSRGEPFGWSRLDAQQARAASGPGARRVTAEQTRPPARATPGSQPVRSARDPERRVGARALRPTIREDTMGGTLGSRPSGKFPASAVCLAGSNLVLPGGSPMRGLQASPLARGMHTARAEGLPFTILGSQPLSHITHSAGKRVSDFIRPATPRKPSSPRRGHPGRRPAAPSAGPPAPAAGRPCRGLPPSSRHRYSSSTT